VDVVFSNNAAELIIKMKDLFFGNVFDVREFNGSSHCCLKVMMTPKKGWNP